MNDCVAQELCCLCLIKVGWGCLFISVCPKIVSVYQFLLSLIRGWASLICVSVREREGVCGVIEGCECVEGRGGVVIGKKMYCAKHGYFIVVVMI